MVWTRSCCASLPGLRNRFWQCPHKCTAVAVAAMVGPAALDELLDGMSDTLPSDPKSVAMDTAVLSVAVAVALPALRVARGSCGSINDRLRAFRFGGDMP